VINWTTALPELILSLCGMAIMMFGVAKRGVTQGDDTYFACSMLTIAAFVLTALLVVASSVGVGFGGLFVVDAFSAFIKLLVLAGSIMAVMVSLDYNRDHELDRFEFPVLILFSTVGMMLMASASNWN